MSLSSRLSPRATEPKTRILHTPWRSAALRIAARFSPRSVSRLAISLLSITQARQDCPQETDQRVPDHSASLEHFLVIDLLRKNAGGHIRDAGQREYLEPHVIRGNHFRNRRHANHVCAD